MKKKNWERLERLVFRYADHAPCLSISVRILAHAPMPEQESPHSVQCPAANSGERSVALKSDRVGTGAVNDV